MAMFATGSREESLDLVQEAMLGFVRRYSSRPEPEWRVLFYRVLQSRITDWRRRMSVRRRFLSWFGRKGAEKQEDPMNGVPDPSAPDPADQVYRQQFAQALDGPLRKLLPEKRHEIRERWRQMTPEERKKVRQKWRGLPPGARREHLERVGE
jgi:RNA polymerase sigma-70 factor (ECF subfamily)